MALGRTDQVIEIFFPRDHRASRRGNRDKFGMFRCGTGGEQRKHEQGKAGKHRALSERPGVSIIYRRTQLWLAIQHRCTQN